MPLNKQQCECIYSHRWAFQKRPDIPSTSKPSSLPGWPIPRKWCFEDIFRNVRLCDCPGLVFPSKAPRPLQILMGSFPISQVVTNWNNYQQSQPLFCHRHFTNHQHCPILIDLQCTPKLFLIFVLIHLVTICNKHSTKKHCPHVENIKGAGALLCRAVPCWAPWHPPSSWIAC